MLNWRLRRQRRGPCIASNKKYAASGPRIQSDVWPHLPSLCLDVGQERQGVVVSGVQPQHLHQGPRPGTVSVAVEESVDT